MVKRTSVKDVHRDHPTGRARRIDQLADFGAAAERPATPVRADCDTSRSVIIIEKRALIRDCLLRCFRQASDIDVIAVGDVDGCLEHASRTTAALVILSLPGTSRSAEAQRDIARLAQGADVQPIIVLSDDDDLEQIVSILDSGVRGYIPTSLPLDVAIEAVRLVRAGGIFVPASSLATVRRSGDAACGTPRSANGIFTARQAAVVDALRRGKANKVIAYELKMRESTVKVHVRNIMKKLNAKNRTEVAFMTNELIRAGDNHVR